MNNNNELSRKKDFLPHFNLNRKTLGVIAVGTILFLAGCSTGVAANKSEAETDYRLIDVAAASYQTTDSDGDTTTHSSDTESFWRGKNDNEIIRCLHSGGALTPETNSCELFNHRPEQLSFTSQLLAVNKGHGFAAQSVWVDDSGMSICNHNVHWWDGYIEKATGCSKFEKPKQIGSDSVLTGISAGKGQEPQSFWNNPDGSVTQCLHEAELTGFLGLGEKLFGREKSCSSLNVPYDKFPKGLESPLFAGATSDESHSAETFWQDADGTLVRCEHEKELSGWFTDRHFGLAKSCDLWKAPKIN